MSTTPSSGIDPRALGLHRQPPARDVPYVPTDEPVVTAMLRFAHVTSTDVVYDLGCGDGRIVIAAARQCGARGVGVDIDPQRIMEAREAAKKAGVTDRVQFLCQSFFDTNIRDATVLMLYLLPSINVKLRPKLLDELRPGSRIIANYFDMGDWPADIRADVHHRVLLQWIIPASIAGLWKCVVNLPTGRHRMTLRLKRRFQTVTGTARVGRRELIVSNGKLFGDQMTFKLASPEGAIRFGCTVQGKTLRGTCESGIIGIPAHWGGIFAGI